VLFLTQHLALTPSNAPAYRLITAKQSLRRCRT
jgi:hypothetical protein